MATQKDNSSKSLARKVFTSVWALVTGIVGLIAGIVTVRLYYETPKVELVGELKYSRIIIPKAMRKDIDKILDDIASAKKLAVQTQNSNNNKDVDISQLPSTLVSRPWDHMPLLDTWKDFYFEIDSVWILNIRNSGTKEAQRLKLAIPSDIKLVQVDHTGLPTETYPLFKDYTIADLRNISRDIVDSKKTTTIDLKSLQPSEEINVHAWSGVGLFPAFRANDFKISHSEGTGQIKGTVNPFQPSLLDRYLGPIITGVSSAFSLALILWAYMRFQNRPRKRANKIQ